MNCLSLISYQSTPEPITFADISHKNKTKLGISEIELFFAMLLLFYISRILNDLIKNNH